MSNDLSNILRDWPYQHGQLSVRIIEGDDGRPKIQLRLDLGVLQMETEGRPDGQRPLGHDSFLEYVEAQLDEHLASGANPEAFRLDSDTSRQLREEAVQYYHRYVALFVLEDYEGVVRDTSRNLRVLDLCARHAESDEDREVLEQFRPYILMMRARARASQAVKDREPKAALLAIDEAVDDIRAHFSEIGEPEKASDSSEIRLLVGMRDALVPKLPTSPKSELRERLKKAVEQENYELAAILRDELRMMPE